MHIHTFGLHYSTRTHAHAHTNKAKKADPCEAQLKCIAAQ